MSGYLLTAAAAHQRAVAAATRLSSIHKMKPGDRLGIVVPTAGPSPAAAAGEAAVAALAFGALRVGIIPVMINPLLAPEESEGYLSDVSAAMVVRSAAQARSLTDPSGLPGSGVPELAAVPLGRPMHFTSGTTGRSKGVWSGILDEEAAAAYWRDEHAQWSVTPDDVLLNHGPLAHSAPLRFSFLAFLHGASIVYTGGFDTVRTSAAIVEFEPTVAMAVPTHLQRLLHQPGGPPRSSYRQLVHAGSACPPDLKRSIHDWAGVDSVWEFLGSTEGQFTACSGAEWEERPGTLGRARAGRRLVIDDGSLSGQAGVIWCVAGAVGRFEYFNDPVKTAAAWAHLPDQSRAFTVGDLGRLDEAGYLYLHGRRTDLIVTGGVNVYPAEVESELRACPAVFDVAVYGLPDADWGERVCAAIVATDATTSASAIQSWARRHLAAYRRPKQVDLVAELPLTSTGKVRRDGLAQWVREHVVRTH